MAWRFKASKYKNAAPIVPKPEACIRDICVGSYQTYGNNICASAAFMAFNWEHVGSSMAVLPLDDCGRKSKTMPLLHAHSDTITDMEFSPFHDGLLLTGSQDSLVKVWHIPQEGLKESLSTPECTLSQKQRRVENVGFHPVADGLIHVASGHDFALWDLTTQKEAFVNKDHGEVIQSTSWKKDGKLVATSCKDKKVRILDPRVESPVLGVANSHQNIKDSRLVWLGDTDRILTTGFDSARLRQIMIRDIRNLSQTQKTLELDCSTGVLMPLFDPDTNMLFLAGKGDTTILYMELSDREPYLIEGLRHSGEQTKGACLVPKRALRVMEGEVNRVLQLTGSSVVPIMYQVPRKSYRDFHADLYPDTRGAVTFLSAPMWLQHQDCAVPSVSLHPAERAAQVHRGNLEELVNAILAMPVPKKNDQKLIVTQKVEEPVKQTQKPVQQEQTDEDRIDFVNVKDIIKGMEKQKPEPRDYSKETNGFQKKITDNGHDYEKKLEDEDLQKADEDEKTIRSDKSLEKTESSDSSESLSRSNSYVNGVPVQVPKPLPRSSISEAGSSDDQVSEAPKPKPRTTAIPVSGYKPRLGPKPFSASAGSEEFSFDKVFSVPVVPGLTKSDSGSSPVASEARPVKDEEKEKSLSPTSDVEVAPNKEEYTNGKSDTSLEEEVNSSDSGYRPKTPSTADRRKMFEATDGAGQSIAERRRAYESRSLSAAPDHDAPPSPAPLRRRDSLKSRKSPDREEKRSSVPNVPTKRTSTVFGKVSKFRHLKGTPGHKSTHVENIKNISRQISGECNGFYGNGVRCAVPVGGGAGGGRLGVVELPRGSTSAARAAPPHPAALHPPALLHAAPLADWAFDPFAPRRLLVACDDGCVRDWLLPDDGVVELPRGSTSAARAAPPHPAALHPPALLHAAPLADWAFDPFAPRRLLVACDDGCVRDWLLPDDGVVELPRGSTSAARAAPPHPAALHPPALLHAAPLADWAFDPFAPRRLLVACDDGCVRDWLLPDDGVVELPRGSTSAARAAPPHPAALHPPALLHAAPLADWAFDPFAPRRLLVACDDGCVRDWLLPDDGLQESTNEPNRTFSAHPDKIYIIRFHPTASDLLTTAAHDLTIKIWDLSQETPTAEITLTGHTEQIFALDWSTCGEYLATVCKDGFVRIYKPRSSAEPLRRGPGPVGSRGARVVWALHDTHLVLTGFDKVSERQILLYNASDLSTPVCTVSLDVSPAILHIHIDHDSNTLFLTGRGDSTIYCYEVTSEAPYLCALSHHRCATLHQGIVFLQKNLLAVEKVEFARALRLTNGTIEPLSFTVPRIKSELFQDDLFPPTLVTWSPWQSARSWLAGERVAPRIVSLQPPGMESLSSQQATAPAKEKPPQKPKPDLIKSHVPMDPKEKQDSIMKAMSARVTMNLKLEQDSMEGVDEAEWDQ